ncbi:MAG: sodium/glutamate symporter [Myxococcaceae bacterium]
MLTVQLNAAQVLALSCVGVMLGVWLKRALPVLERLNVPAPIVGGLVYALVALALRDRVVNFEMDLVLRDILMVAFFTTIGMSASLRLLLRGGAQVVIFLVIASVGAVLQNGVGIAVAKLLGLSPLIGIVSGSVALTGGPATALSFGPLFEGMGVGGATTVGVASAMFGITAGGLMGGFIGGQLIARHQLKPEREKRPAAVSVEGSDERGPFFVNLVAVTAAMGLGTLVSAGLQRLGLIVPAYVGAMLVAAILRNIDDATGVFGLSEHHVEEIGNVSLSIFIVMALLTLKLWELVSLALPILVLLAVQVVLVYLLCVAVFRAMGKDYEAAVMAGGFCGLMLGTTANAMACMTELSRKHGPAPRAFIVVPLVGAFLIDFTNSVVITGMVNLLSGGR